MKHRNHRFRYVPYIILVVISLSFFYKTLLGGKIPFPGDLLLTQYGPWRHQSYDGYVAGAIPSKDQYFDVVRELYPWKTLVVNQMKRGELPLWNPYNFSGAPLMANVQSQVLYPLTIIYFLLPQIIAWTVMVILQPVLGTAFMYLFATEIGMSSIAAILSAILFNFSSFATVWMEFSTVWHTILWLPLLLYFIERAIKQQRLNMFQSFVFMFALFSSITGGHPQDFIYTFTFFIVYGSVRLYLSRFTTAALKWKLLLQYIAPVVTAAFLLAAPQLFPTIELFANSARVPHDYTGLITNMLIQWWQFPVILVTDFFGNPATGSSITGDYVSKTLSVGIVGFMLALISVFSVNKPRIIKLSIILTSVLLLVTFRSPLSELLYRFPIPLLSTGTPTRILFLLMFSLSVLAGFGFDKGKSDPVAVRNSIATTWLILGVLWLLIVFKPDLEFSFLTPQSYVIMNRALLFSTVIAIAASGVLIISRFKYFALFLLIPLCAAELLYGFLKFNPFVPSSFIFPDNQLIQYLQKTTGNDRYWGYGTAETEANFATQVQLFSTDGTDPLNLLWYNQFIQSSSDGNIARTFTRRTRSDAKIATGYGERDLPENKYRLKVMDLLGVKYVIDRSENPKNENTFSTDRFTPVWHERDWTVYKNNFAAPRAFLSGDIRYYTSMKDFEAKFFDDSFDVSKSVLIEQEFNTDTQNILPGIGTVSITEYTPNHISIKTDSSTPQLLFLSDTYDKNWDAVVDNKSSTLYKTNYAFRGVLVPAGKHDVKMSYRPKSLTYGIYVSLFAAFVCLLAFILYNMNRKSTSLNNFTK